jgi:hypothetical protein
MIRLTIALLLCLSMLSSRTRAVDVDPGADEFVITANIPPFAIEAARRHVGILGLDEGILGEAPENVSAGVEYTDEARGFSVEVGVTRHAQILFLDHFIEAKSRDRATARMDPSSSMVSLFGQAVLAYCYKPPDCTRREYTWRSGNQIVIEVEPKAFSNELKRIPCPEPTEILQAYLQRYPSSLTLYTEDDEHAKKWRRDQTALELAAADYQLDQRYTSVPAEDQWLALAAARDHLISFAELRQAAFRGPDAAKERGRIDKLRDLPSGTQLDELKKIRLEYRQWWSTHQNDPVYLPPR